MKKRRLIFLGLMTLLLLVGCGGNQGSYADVFNFKDRHYLKNPEMTTIDTSKLKEISRIKDSTRLEKVSLIYEIEGYPDHDVLAVRDKDSVTGISVYGEMEEDGISFQFKSDKSYSDVVEIKILRGSEQVNILQGKEVQQFLSLFNQRGAENEFIWDRTNQYDVIFLTETLFQYKYPILQQERIFVYPWTESKLPDEIGEFFAAKE